MADGEHIRPVEVGEYIQLNVDDAAPSPARAAKSYEKQLSVARQLAGFKARARIKEALLMGDEERLRRIEEGAEPIDPDPGARRGDYVKRAAEALFISLLFTGDDTPIIGDIRAELSAALNRDVEFIYPPGGKMRLMIREDGKMRPLTDDEQRSLVPVLKMITSQRIDSIMQGHPGRRKL